ncbi:site-specific DNA-methyltransferase [Psychrobacter sp. APC 3350]|uniref:site-specific DNA-methyltransferase n=1 Tax=Psychrobacter sp. APC 3350 TaxID=3035195 RepID=UPI0025B3134E|nr:site-specific DNA-methyltransferase [Psychrobacter sp. APC 3350]MDN3454385.1 site-specific DNA-methyltransferase [Psychrobacter sp. APC 3350]
MTNLSTETLFDETETANSKQIAILKKHFPQCFDKDGHFQPEKMMEVVKANEVDMVKESYSLNWLGKAYARLLTNLPPQKLLKPDTTHNESPENSDSGNILIKGDNLEVLKHLVNGYREKIKMIYIDPPYNTGSDGFVYQDNFKFTVDDLSRLAGIDKAEAERILSFNTKGSNSHSAWLTFMYPRLYIARELMRDDSVIFVSIDDNEQAQLKLLCDEVFGENNFLAKCIHKNNSNKNQSKFIGVSTEYVFIYAKNLDMLSQKSDEWRIEKEGAKDIAKKFKELQKMGLPLSEIEKEIKQMYKRPKYSHLSRWNKIDKHGVFKDENISREGGRKDYTIINPHTGEPCTIPPRGWGKSYEELLELQSKDLIWYGDESTAPGYKYYIEEEQLSVADNFWYFDNSTDTRFIKNIFGKLVFDNPKPLDMIKRTLLLGSDKNSITLDFFAGSGTTAHAVMQLNSEDKGNRQFILVQLPEDLDETLKTVDPSAKKTIQNAIEWLDDNDKPHNLFEITKARIEKVAAQIQADHPDYISDLGFKVYDTANDFRPKIDDDFEVTNESLFDDIVLTDEQYQALLTTWMLYDNNELTADITSIDLQGYNAELINKNLYLIASDFGTRNLKCLLDKLDEDKSFVPDRIIVNGYNFDTAMQMELNEAIRSYQNKKKITINIIVRY